VLFEGDKAVLLLPLLHPRLGCSSLFEWSRLAKRNLGVRMPSVKAIYNFMDFTNSHNIAFEARNEALLFTFLKLLFNERITASPAPWSKVKDARKSCSAPDDVVKNGFGSA
jgi:hypothetical protein